MSASVAESFDAAVQPLPLMAVGPVPVKTWRVQSWRDTMISTKNVWPDVSRGKRGAEVGIPLDWAAHTYTDTPPWKPKSKGKGGRPRFETFDDLAWYNAADVFNTMRLRKGIDAEVAREKLNPEQIAVDVALQSVAVDMQWAGVPIDLDRLKEVELDAHRQLMDAQAQLDGIIGRHLDVFRTADLVDVLFRQWGLPVIKRTEKSKQPATDEETLKDLPPHPGLGLILDIRKASKVLSTTVRPLYRLVRDGRMHPSWRACATVTGRFTSSPNFQNYPQWLRRIVRPRPGRVLVGADYAALEQRIMAALVGGDLFAFVNKPDDDAHKFDPSFDCHSHIAALVFGAQFTNPAAYIENISSLPEEQIKKLIKAKQKAIRDLTKRVVYARNYGSGLDTILAIVREEDRNTQKGDVKNVIDAYDGRFPELPKYRIGMQMHAEKARAVFSRILGRRRSFPYGEVALTDAANFPIQGCLPASTRVATSAGLLPIGQVEEGRVWTGRRWSDFQRVAQGPCELAEIGLINGQTLRCDTRHEVLVCDGQSYKFRAWRELGTGDRVCLNLFPFDGINQSGLDSEEAYWLGYATGNGSTNRNALTMVIGTRKSRYLPETKAAEWAAFVVARGFSFSKPQIYDHHRSVTVESRAFRRRWEAFGYSWEARAWDKRIPSSIWRGDAAIRRAFLLGLFDADGTTGHCPRSVGQPGLHMCQRELLEEVQILARSVGLDSKLHGPYRPDKRKPHLISYRLDLLAAQMAAVLGFGPPCKLRTNDLAPRDAITAFLNQVQLRDLPPRSSEATLFHRMRKGGDISVQKLSAMALGLGVDVGPLYATSMVCSKQALGRIEETYTLTVDDPEHRYDSEGVISKNTASDIVNLALLRVLPLMPPGTNFIVHGHDALDFECEERYGPEVRGILDEHLPARYDFGFGSMLFDAKAKIGEDWSQI